MCGIVGYTGNKQAAPILIAGLKKLEYRGYDSAGLAVSDGEQLRIAKAKGHLEVLRDKTQDGAALPGTSGLGHTRWATHGRPSEENCHPHLSENGRIAIVHNGIIENYMPLKEMLEHRNRHFSSETDTEVVAQLIDFYYKGDLLDAVSQAVRELEGSYALGVMCEDEPGTLIAVKCRAPLIVAYGEGENFFASDVIAVLEHTRSVSYLEDEEIAVVRRDSVAFYSSFLDPIEKKRETVDWDVGAADKGGYEHYMFKEIMEQPEAVRRTVAQHIRDGRADLSDALSPEFARTLDKIYIVACGSSYHVGVIAKHNIERLARLPVEVVLSSEFRYSDPLLTKNTLVVFISQSGETADTLEALFEAKKRGAPTLSIVNVEGSSIAKASDSVLYTKAGPEIAVATTKAYSTQLAMTVLLALYLAELRGQIGGGEYETVLGELLAVPEKLVQILNEKAKIQYLAYQYFNNEDIFFIGRNIDYALSLEGSLKLKEISYIHSGAYAAGELKHGTISLVEDGTLVVAVATYGRLLEKTLNNAREVLARGAKVLAITAESGKNAFARTTEHVLTIPDTHEAILPALAVLPLQLFAYYMAVYRGCDIDKPRNLAKSVTVE
ncbi:MAG: glutamine--fructose-6-phosphate transaminase (isomerizing) [Firmicutes bacterium]|nr:glutamine--fructose-6-phosphate transaminase (isomerizing) [Bacillota bacterium]